MKLNEKIAWYRRAAKLSQEELAARVGVSRQAVSKWELGESAPEVTKLVALARIFGVTADQLLSEDEPSGAPPNDPPGAPDPSAPSGSHRPATHYLARMIRRWGWLAGVYLALQGVGVALVGGVARYAFGRMFRPIVPLGGLSGALGDGYWEISLDGAPIRNTGLSGFGAVFETVATVILAVGILMIVAGIALALVLRLRGRK